MTWPTGLTRGTPGGSNGSQIGGAPATAAQSPAQGGDFQRLTGQRRGSSEMSRLLGQKPQSDFQRLMAQRKQDPVAPVKERVPPPPHSVEDLQQREDNRRRVYNVAKAAAFLGLRRVLPRLHPVVGLLVFAYEAYQQSIQRIYTVSLSNYTLERNCNGTGAIWAAAPLTTGCINVTLPKTYMAERPIVDGQKIGTYNFVAETFNGTTYQKGDQWMPKFAGAKANFKTWDFRYPEPDELPELGALPMPGAWALPIVDMPYALLPYRQPRLDRHPDEQTQRGNSVLAGGLRPVRRIVSSIIRATASQRLTWRQEQALRRAGQPGRGADGREDSGEDIRKSDVPGSDRMPEKDSEPGADAGESSDPGISDQSRDYSQDDDFNSGPEFDPRQDWTDDVGPDVDLPIDPVIREDWHAGQPGPTVSYGSDLASPPHVREPAPPKTKERKRVAFRPNQAFLIKKGLNPISEVLEALDCAYKALPKKLQRQAQLASWATQRVRAEEAGVTLRRNPGHQRDSSGRIKPGADAPSVPLWGKESLTLPGFSSNARDKGNLYRDPNAHYFQPMSPQQKAEAVYLNAFELDIDKMLSCMGADMLEDTVIGKFGQQVGKASARLRMSTGLGSSIF